MGKIGKLKPDPVGQFGVSLRLKADWLISLLKMWPGQ